MKKTLLFAILLIGGLSQLNAQCAIMPTCSITTSGYCTSPLENTNLPNATELSPYNTTIQFSLGTMAGGVVAITDASISSVVGMPAGFTYSTNPSSGSFLAGSNACLILTGTPAAASAGTYTIDVSFVVNTSFGPATQTLSWLLSIDPTGTTGIKAYAVASNFMVYPNPVASELFVSSTSHFNKIQVIDALGKIVISRDANYTSQTTINVSDLNKGIYFLQMNDGSTVITRKFIKE
jgi:hypothetical protein